MEDVVVDFIREINNKGYKIPGILRDRGHQLVVGFCPCGICPTAVDFKTQTGWIFSRKRRDPVLLPKSGDLSPPMAGFHRRNWGSVLSFRIQKNSAL